MASAEAVVGAPHGEAHVTARSAAAAAPPALRPRRAAIRTAASEAGARDPGTERRDGVQVIARAAEVLRQLADEPLGLSARELAARTGLARSTCHRIAAALGEEGFVGVSASGRLQIGTGLIGLAADSRRDLHLEVAPHLERLSRTVGETVDLAMLDGREVLFVDQYTSSRALRIVSEIGARFPAYCTANGKVLLARLDEQGLEAALPPRLAAQTANTIVDRARLLDELRLVRATGIAFDREECSPGICAVGVTVCDSDGSVAAITIVVPASRFEGNEGTLAAALLSTRDEIQRTLGQL